MTTRKKPTAAAQPAPAPAVQPGAQVLAPQVTPQVLQPAVFELVGVTVIRN